MALGPSAGIIGGALRGIMNSWKVIVPGAAAGLTVEGATNAAGKGGWLSQWWRGGTQAGAQEVSATQAIDSLFDSVSGASNGLTTLISGGIAQFCEFLNYMGFKPAGEWAEKLRGFEQHTQAVINTRVQASREQGTNTLEESAQDPNSQSYDPNAPAPTGGDGINVGALTTGVAATTLATAAALTPAAIKKFGPQSNNGGTPPAEAVKPTGPTVTGTPGDTPNKPSTIASAMTEALEDVAAMDADAHAQKPATPHASGNGGGNLRMSKWVKGGIGGIALTTAFGVGTRMAFAGEDIQEATVDTLTQDIPFVQAGIEATNGNMEEAAYLATVDTAGTAGMVGGGALGVWGGAAVGAAIGSVVPIVGTAAGGVVGGIIGGLAGSTAGGMGGAIVGDAIYNNTATFNSAAQNVEVNGQDWGQQYVQQQIALQNAAMARAYGTTPNTVNFNVNAANGGQTAPINPAAVYNPNVGSAGITGPNANADYKMDLAM